MKNFYGRDKHHMGKSDFALANAPQEGALGLTFAAGFMGFAEGAAGSFCPNYSITT